MKFSIYTLFLLAFCSPLLAQENKTSIYLSPLGNDNASGKKDAPLLSLSVALKKSEMLRQQRNIDDTVFVRIASGNYYLDSPIKIDTQLSGTSKSPLVIIGDEKNQPTFYGGIPLNHFEKVNNSLWRVYVPETKFGFRFEQLVVNDNWRFRAQTPNRGEFYSPKNLKETILDTTIVDRCYPLVALQMDFADNQSQWLYDIEDREVNDVIISAYHKWDVTRLRLQYIRPTNNTAFFIQNKVQPWSKIDLKSKLIIQNYKKALDQAGEWFLAKDGYLYYMPFPNENIETTVAIAPVAEQFLIIAGDSSGGKKAGNVIFKNLHFSISSYITPFEGNSPSQAAAKVDAAVMIDFAEKIHFYNCEFSNIGRSAIWFRKSCTHSSVINSHIHNVGASGIKIGEALELPPKNDDLTGHITISNNIIQHGGYVFPEAVGVIIFHAHDNQITHNDIADFKYTGISVGWVWGYTPSPSKRNKIEYNYIHHLGWNELSDMGGVYTLGLSEGTSVSNNVISHIYSRYYGGWGIYTDEGSTGVSIQNNLVYNCKSGAFHQHYGENNLIKNNIFVNQIRAQLEASRVETHNSFTFTNNIIYFDKGKLADLNWDKVQFVSDNNCYWSSESKDLFFSSTPFKKWQKKGKDRHAVIANPQFTNIATFDFTINNKSMIKKIGFIPFDYKKAGVYGSADWIQKSKLPKTTTDSFDKLVQETEKEKVSDW